LIVNGLHTTPGGYNAIQRLIKTKVKFTAVITSNDTSAIGAMRAIRDTTSLQIPRDIAIIGFDDQPSAVAQVPPLASVHVPLMEVGQQALTLMSDYLMHQRALESVQIPTRLIPRQSCGCLPQAMISASEKKSALRVSSNSRADGVDKIQRRIADEMSAALPHSSRFPFGERTYGFCISLVKAFYISLKEGNSTHFQEKLMSFLQEMEHTDENVDSWQNTISALRREMVKLPRHGGRQGRSALRRICCTRREPH
jgi:hypothetical protein